MTTRPCRRTRGRFHPARTPRSPRGPRPAHRDPGEAGLRPSPRQQPQAAARHAAPAAWAPTETSSITRTSSPARSRSRPLTARTPDNDSAVRKCTPCRAGGDGEGPSAMPLLEWPSRAPVPRSRAAGADPGNGAAAPRDVADRLHRRTWLLTSRSSDSDQGRRQRLPRPVRCRLPEAPRLGGIAAARSTTPAGQPFDPEKEGAQRRADRAARIRSGSSPRTTRLPRRRPRSAGATSPPAARYPTCASSPKAVVNAADEPAVVMYFMIHPDHRGPGMSKRPVVGALDAAGPIGFALGRGLPGSPGCRRRRPLHGRPAFYKGPLRMYEAGPGSRSP